MDIVMELINASRLWLFPAALGLSLWVLVRQTLDAFRAPAPQEVPVRVADTVRRSRRTWR